MIYRLRWLAVRTGKGCANHRMRYTYVDNTRQGYAHKSILKPAGYSFLGV